MVALLFQHIIFTTDTYLEIVSAEDIESFKYLHFKIFGNRLETKIVYTDFNIYRELTLRQKKFRRPDKRRRKKNKNFTCQQNQIFCIRTYASKIKNKHVIKIKIGWKSLVKHSHWQRAIFFKIFI